MRSPSDKALLLTETMDLGGDLISVTWKHL